MFLNGYPYTDFHEMNADFILKAVQQLQQAFKNFTASNSLIFAEPLLHDITKSYAKNTIVLDLDGNAYISLQNVPEGIQLANADYWLMVFNFEEYTEKANKNFTVNYFRDTTRAPYALAVGDWIVLDDVLYKVIISIAADGLFEVDTNIVHFTIEQFLKEFIQTVNNTLYNYSLTIQQYKNDIDTSELAYRNQLAQDIANTTATLTAQLNQAISGVTVNSEIIDARVGYDNTTYTTLGEAIRTQVDDIHVGLDPLVPKNLVDLSDTETVTSGASYSVTNHVGTIIPTDPWGWLRVSFLFNVDSDSDYFVHSDIEYTNPTNQNAVINYLDASNTNLGQVLIKESLLVHTPATCAKIRINVFLSRDNNASLSDSVVINELSITKREYSVNVINKLNNKKYIFIGDSYGVGYNPDDVNQKSWCELVKQFCGLTEGVDVFTFAASGYGFANPNGEFETLLSNARNAISDTLSITDIIVLGGINDATIVTDANCRTKIYNFCVNAKSYFPNAKVHVGMISGSRNISIKNDLPRVINNYTFAALNENACYIDNIQYALCDKRLLSSDGTHPSAGGYQFLSRHIANYIKNGNVNISRQKESIGLDHGNIEWTQQNELETLYHNVSYNPGISTMQSSTWYTLSGGLGVTTPFNAYGESLWVGTILVHCDDSNGNPTTLERRLRIRFTNYNYEYQIYANGESETYNNVTQIDIQIGYMTLPALYF